MKILDNIATKIADKVNAKNDEVMLLTQENELLQQKLAASELTVSDYQKKISASDKKVESFRNDLEFKVKQLKNVKSEYDRVKNNYDELSKKKCDTKLKEINKQLVEEVNTQKDKANKNYLYNKTFRYISDEQNRQTIIDNFSHNLSKWISNKNLTDTEVAKKLGTSRNIVGNLRTGKRAVNVNTIQKFDIKLCEYFECSVYELVTVKMEASQ